VRTPDTPGFVPLAPSGGGGSEGVKDGGGPL
jgi:hypothetical protein